MDTLPIELVQVIALYAKPSARTMLRACCKSYYNSINIGVMDGYIFAEQCCYDGDLRLFRLAIEEWKQPLLSIYYVPAVQSGCIDILKYLHMYNVQPPKDILYHVALYGNKTMWKYVISVFTGYDRRQAETVHRPWIECNTYDSSMLSLALSNGNLNYIQACFRQGLKPSTFEVNVLLLTYRTNRSLKELVYWIIEAYSKGLYLVDADDYNLLPEDYKFDLVECLNSAAITVISRQYNLQLTREMSLKEIIELLPSNAHMDCKSKYAGVSSSYTALLLYCEQHDIKVKYITGPSSCYPYNDISTEELDCLKRRGIELLYPQYLYINFQLVKNWLITNYPNKYDDKYFFEIAVGLGIVSEVKKHTSFTIANFSWVFETSNQIAIWNWVYDHLEPSNKKIDVSNYDLKRIFWLKSRELLDTEAAWQYLTHHRIYSDDDIERIMRE